MNTIISIFKNSLKPGYLRIMLDKVKKRILEPSPKKIKLQATAWYASRACDTFEYITALDNTLCDEARAYNEKLQAHGQDLIATLPVKMGGGGNCVLLYFLARYLKPSVIVETGVSMGFSSHAFLTALKVNNKGHLYSSDFPYFRLPNPEQYIGCVVEPELKDRWTLYIEGDVKNLARIASQVDQIDLFHYDSDKSYEGRKLALHLLEKQLGSSTIIFDDIGDNFHFRDWVESKAFPYVILSNPAGGYVGVTGNILQGQ
jgi:predicted O-methyltransferase YrrM